MVNPRPLSPHLQVYRWQAQMVASILHRATGVILAAGMVLIVAALFLMTAGPQAWDGLRHHAGAWYGQVFLFLWTWAFTFHLLNGIRNLWQDGGKGMEKTAFARNSWLASIGSLLMALAVWAVVCLNGGMT
jgi:succinate dehydrogenase / fumarate reductase cytochrome b subunit